MNTEQNPAAGTAAAYKDRKTGLVIFGILEIVQGGLCALAMLAYLGVVRRYFRAPCQCAASGAPGG